jgi:hypothetical protein
MKVESSFCEPLELPHAVLLNKTKTFKNERF